MGTRERRARSDQYDKELISLFNGALSSHSAGGISEENIVLLATGGYGRGELVPGSDIDIAFVYEKISEEILKTFVNEILFPLWDKGLKIDYSVRNRQELRVALKSDVKVTLGLLDSRYVTGQMKYADDVAKLALDVWQKNFRNFLQVIEPTLDERYERSGELAFLLEPDLKEARGGLRDITLLRAFEKCEPSSINLSRIGEAESTLSNIRETLHTIAGNDRDTLLFAMQDKVAEALGYQDADALMLEVSKSARLVDFAMKRAWEYYKQPKPSRFKKTKTENVGKGLIAQRNELLFEESYPIDQDPGLGIRAAAIAAQRGLKLSASAIHQLAENLTELPKPWPRSTREEFVAFIGAGKDMVEVFEALDQEGLISKWIPEWEHVRFLPQRNVLHRHTVDRHMLETVVRAATLTRKVHRPDLLLVSALFHDIGKGYPNQDHSRFGAMLITPLAHRMGFNSEDCAILQKLVEEHLTLSSAATRRDLDDPQTIHDVVTAVGDASTLELLHALSIADGEATGKGAWSSWKARLVSDLVERALGAMAGISYASEIAPTPEQIERAFKEEPTVEIVNNGDFLEIEVIAPDRAGLLYTVAAVLAISRMEVRSAKTRTVANTAFMNWLVQLDPHAPEPTSESLTRTLERALRGEIDLNAKIEERIRNYRALPSVQTPAALVTAVNDAATNATVLEVRMHDRPGVLFNVSRTISRYRVDIRSAIVTTLGAEAIDTLYLTDLEGNALSSEEATLLARRVENYLLTL